MNDTGTAQIGSDQAAQQDAPVRVQRMRTRGWRMPPNTVSVTRPGKWGNPYTIKGAREADYRGTDAELAQCCVSAFRNHWIGIPEDIRARTLAPLRGKNLACWCAIGSPCHGDVLLEFANAEPARSPAPPFAGRSR